MRKIIEKYPSESDLQFEERFNLMLMCDFAHELISQRRFNNETAALTYIMNLDYFKRINIDKQFDVLVINKDKYNVITLNIKITCKQWKALYEAYSTVNEWVIDNDHNCIFNLQSCKTLGIPEDYDLWQQDNNANNQRIIDERLIRYIISNDILTRKSAK